LADKGDYLSWAKRRRPDFNGVAGSPAFVPDEDLREPLDRMFRDLLGTAADASPAEPAARPVSTMTAIELGIGKKLRDDEIDEPAFAALLEHLALGGVDAAGPTITRLTDELDDEGLIFRRAAKDDARKINVYLSCAGSSRLSRVNALIAARLASSGTE
jgi:hypothetical protein